MTLISILLERFIVNKILQIFEDPKDNTQRIQINDSKLGVYELVNVKINIKRFNEQFLFKLAFGHLEKFKVIIDSNPLNISL